MAEINVTPFVDVMLVLLIIFMVTAPLLTAGVPIDLPDSRAKALSEQRDKVTISLARDGTVVVDDAQMALADLPGALAALPPGASGKPPLVTLRADKALDYGAVMAVMGELNRAGFNAITLVTNASASVPQPSAARASASDVAPVEPAEDVIDGSGGAP
jgi:biopolymer transport protein TolR